MDLNSIVTALAAIIALLVAVGGFNQCKKWFNSNNRKISDRKDEPTNGSKPQKLRVLHMLGAEKNEFYHNLSKYFAQECVGYLETKPLITNKMEFLYCVVHPKGTKFGEHSDGTDQIMITFPRCLDDTIIYDKNAKKYEYNDAVSKLNSLNIDCAVTHMFDDLGTTQYRDLLEYTLNIPFIGSNSQAMKLTNDKYQTKLVLKNNGVSVPHGILLDAKDSNYNYKEIVNDSCELDRLLCDNKLKYPLIVKACNEDNSIGLGLAHNREELVECILNCFKYDDKIVIEEYISLGKEVRMAIIEDKENDASDIKYYRLPIVSYLLDASNKKIKEQKDKVFFNDNGELAGFTAPKYETVIGNEYVTEKELNLVRNACIAAHKVLNCRDFSQFDIRIDENGIPYILEANLHCCWAPRSVVVAMANAAARSLSDVNGNGNDILYESKPKSFFKHENLFLFLIEQTVKRKFS